MKEEYKWSQQFKMAVNLLEILSYKMQVPSLLSIFFIRRLKKEVVSITTTNYLADVIHSI
jgi:hypothetical protein